MTLVERFIEISNWPTSRKSVLWGCYLLTAHLALWPAFYYFFGRIESPLVDVVSFNWFFAAWTASVALCILLAIPSEIAGRESRWVAYLFVAVYSIFTVLMIYLLGSVSNPHMALGMLMILVSAVYWDAWLGLFAFVCFFALLAIVWFLDATGQLPYAPLILQRSLEAQNDPGLFIVYYVQYLISAFFCLGTLCLVVLARQLQESRLNTAQRLIRRYLPSQVADSILAGQSGSVEQHQRRKLTVFFSDLVGFSEIAEQLEPEELSQVLNEYFTAMTGIADRYDGTVDELVGDAVLILFGAPKVTSDKDHALRAVRMAMEMQDVVSSLNAKWRAAGIDVTFRVRMGINTGVATIGNFGSEGRTKYTALGKHVNLAARIQSQCAPGRVLISHATWLLIDDQIQCKPKGEMQFKGIHKPVMIYELAVQS